MLKSFSLFLAFALTSITVSAAPINITDSDPVIPRESICGFLDLTDAEDLALLPVSNGTHSGILVVNTTILAQAFGSDDILTKRDANAEAEADPWRWLSLSRGQPMYKRDANAEADAEPWRWLSLSRGQPMYKRDANAEADAEPWRWLSLARGQPMY